MMQNNFKQVITLMALMGVASTSFAAPVVSQFNDYRPESNAPAELETVETRLKRFLDNNQNLQVRMQQQLTAQELEIARLNGVVEEQTYRIEQLMERQHQLLIDVAELKEGGSKKSSSSSSAGASSYSAEKDSYNKAVALMQKHNQNTQAIAAFESFLTTYPKSYYTPTAYYWVGQLYFVEKQDANALKNFSEAIKYKKSNKRADSLFKMGEIAKRNNNAQQASKFYNLVISEYPGSSTAKAAQEALSSL